VRGWSVMLVMVMATAGCQHGHRASRHELDSGSGGSGGLSSVRMKIFAAIASGNYQHARELLELAADLGPHERAIFEQTISAAERGLIPFAEDKLSHIFRAENGHFAVETAEARELIQTTAAEAHRLGLASHGYQVYQRILDSGAQIWAFVWKGKNFEAGINQVPETAERLLK